MSGTDWLVLAGVGAASLGLGWLVSGLTARLRGADPRGAARWLDAGATAVFVLLAFVLLTLT